MSRRVLLIIDVQRGFVKEQTQPIVEHIQELLQRETFDLVIQAQWKNYVESRFEQELNYSEMKGHEQTALIFENYGAHIITRSQYSCLTDSLRRLIAKEDMIFIVGLETDACVLATLYDLWDEGYHFKVYRDCIGTNCEELQTPALKLIERNFGTAVFI